MVELIRDTAQMVRKLDDDPDGPFCHILGPDDEPICGAKLSTSRMRRKHFSYQCSGKGCIRCPECERLAGQ